MHPFIELGGRLLPSYSLTGLLGCLIAVLLACWITRSKYGGIHGTALDVENVVYIFVFSGIGTMIGAKILYLITVLPALVQDLPLLFSDFTEFSNRYLAGGFVLYGGLIGGVLTACHTARMYQVPLSRYYPALLPALAVACGMGRIGCFLAGCCYGAQVDAECMFAVTFPVGSLAPAGVPLLPVQLWEAGFDFLLALLLYFLTNRSPFPYLGLAVYGICYSVFRFTVEFFRGDLIRGFWFSLSTSQWISLLVFVLCLADVFYQLKKHKYRS